MYKENHLTTDSSHGNSTPLVISLELSMLQYTQGKHLAGTPQSICLSSRSHVNSSIISVSFIVNKEILYFNTYTILMKRNILFKFQPYICNCLDMGVFQIFVEQNCNLTLCLNNNIFLSGHWAT